MSVSIFSKTYGLGGELHTELIFPAVADQDSGSVGILSVTDARILMVHVCLLCWSFKKA